MKSNITKMHGQKHIKIWIPIHHNRTANVISTSTTQFCRLYSNKNTWWDWRPIPYSRFYHRSQCAEQKVTIFWNSMLYSLIDII